jgi:hypothetical protein
LKLQTIWIIWDCNCSQVNGVFDFFVQAIWEELQDAVHAVDAMVTKTPGEVGK